MSEGRAQELMERLVAGERRALAQAITLVESTRPDHRIQANELLDLLCAPSNDGDEFKASAKRIGISGTPGVGKSTFIEALGLHLIQSGHRVAVLAIDPSSLRTGGSIMGDKTRMIELSRSSDAFIRPSASQGVLGGVANRTGEVIRLVEAAGYDIVIVETVGVGQSEVAVGSITDLFVLLVAPAGGDDLQGIKRGVMELVDAVLVNKADGDLVHVAGHTAADYRHGLSLLQPKRPGHIPPVQACSALSKTGITDAWRTIEGLWNQLDSEGALAPLRSRQATSALNREIEAILVRRLLDSDGISQARAKLEEQVLRGDISPSSAAARFTDLVLESNQGD